MNQYKFRLFSCRSFVLFYLKTNTEKRRNREIILAQEGQSIRLVLSFIKIKLKKEIIENCIEFHLC
jgi:hypothetical protein